MAVAEAGTTIVSMQRGLKGPIRALVLALGPLSVSMQRGLKASRLRSQLRR